MQHDRQRRQQQARNQSRIDQCHGQIMQSQSMCVEPHQHGCPCSPVAFVAGNFTVKSSG
jgi:hypothetical protein